MKRIFLFIATNVAVLVVISVVLRVLGVDSVLARNGSSLDLTSLLVFSAVVGFAGSLISLLMSKWIAKKSTGARVIDTPRNSAESFLLSTVYRHADAAGIGRPEVAIYDSPDVNAFATGASRNHALVAVSSGLLTRLGQPEVEAVLGHEVTHVANGDMVTLALLQGVAEHVRGVSVSRRRLRRRSRHLQDRARVRPGVLHREPRRTDPARDSRDDDRDVVLAAARVPCGRGRREARGPRVDDPRAARPAAHPRAGGVAEGRRGVRYLGRRRARASCGCSCRIRRSRSASQRSSARADARSVARTHAPYRSGVQRSLSLDLSRSPRRRCLRAAAVSATRPRPERTSTSGTRPNTCGRS